MYFLGADAESPLPECCVKARCTLSSWSNAAELGIWYQHGENREHRLFVTDRDTVRRGAAVLFDWLRRIHEYEEAAVRPRV